MGALYGYIRQNTNIRPGLHQTMAEPASYWGRDAHFRFNSPNAILGQLHRINTPEATHENQPWQPIPGQYLFFNGRIDNREDLLKILGEKENEETPDGRIVAAIWEKFREKITDYLEGDWVVVHWDERQRELNIIRDHHGYSALYFYHNPHFFAFATGIKSLLALEEIPKEPDIKRVVQVLTSWQGDGKHSAYKNILRLPPAHTLKLDAKGNVTLNRYWFPENIRPIHFKDENEYYGTFLEEYTRAVRVRLRSHKPVGSQLSGGLDSGSVVALAAALLREKGQRLPAFTSVPAFSVKGLTSVNRFGDEGRLAEMTANFTGNTDWHPVDAAGIDPFLAIQEGVEIHDEPFHAGANTFWISEIKRVAAEMGLGSMLTGQGGNATVSWPTPGFLQRMAKKSDLIKTRDFFTYSGWRHTLLPLYLPQSVKQMIKRSRKNKLPFLDYSALRREYAVQHRVMEMMQEDGHDPDFSKKSSPLETRLKIIKPGSSIVGFLHAQSAAWGDQEMRDPTFDKRLVEYCLAVPDHIYVSGGTDRMLLRKAFDGRMPPEVLWNKRRGRQAADIGYRVVKYKETGNAMLAEIEKSPLCREILDIQRMKTILQGLSQGINQQNSQQAGTILLRGLTCGLFLLRFSMLSTPAH